MAVFAYRGRSGAAAVNGEIEADSRPAAVAALRAKGVVATAVEERKAKAAGARARCGGRWRVRRENRAARKGSHAADGLFARPGVRHR